MKPSLQILGDWQKEVGVPLADALAVSMEISGRSGEQACKHALILMAQSARAIAKRAKKNRPIMRNNAGSQYVETYKQGSRKPHRVYRFQYETQDPKWRLDGTWKNAREISQKNRGLAKRSWMWGLAKLKRVKTGKAIPGASKVFALKGTEWKGYVKENRLDYIKHAMPAGWESEVEQRVGNKIMAQARNKLERKWRKAMQMPRGKRGTPSRDAAFLARYFAA